MFSLNLGALLGQARLQVQDSLKISNRSSAK